MPGVVLGNRLSLLTSLGGALLGVVVLSADCRANFFEELFGAGDYVRSPAIPRVVSTRIGARRPIYHSRPHIAYYPRHRRERPVAFLLPEPDRRNEAPDNRSATGSRPVRPAFCARSGATLKDVSKFRQLLQDKTLRFGDIVVTETGIRVFEGHATCPHAPRDFVTLADADLSRRKLGALSKLEDAIKAVHVRYAHR